MEYCEYNKVSGAVCMPFQIYGHILHVKKVILKIVYMKCSSKDFVTPAILLYNNLIPGRLF